MNNISKIIIAGALAVLSTTAAQAEANDHRTASVQHADLNLSSEAGQKTLTLRIKRAAVAVCTGGNENLSLRAQSAFNKCRDETIAKARASISGLKPTGLAVAAPSE